MQKLVFRRCSFDLGTIRNLPVMTIVFMEGLTDQLRTLHILHTLYYDLSVLLSNVICQSLIGNHDSSVGRIPYILAFGARHTCLVFTFDDFFTRMT